MKNSVTLLLALWLLSVQVVVADDDNEETKTVPQSAPAEVLPDDAKKPSGAAKRAARDQEIAALVDEHNEAVESELDEVVCERIRVTGTRKKVEVCKTKRELAAERDSAKRMLLQRNKAGSDPAQGTGVGSN